MKIALIGYGKMGKEIEKIALSRGHEIVSIIDINNQEDFESDAFKSADVAIEFTNPMVAYNNYMKAFKAGVKLVSGSAECAADELPVSSIREGEVPGIHSIRYDSEADSITITHDAKNRSGFALGAVLAAEYTAGKQGFLGMSDLFPFLKD